jgi:acyl carrier protein
MRNFVLLFLLFGMYYNVNAWGFWAHQRINRMAVFTLPPEMISFYKANIEYITEHAVDPDKRRYAVEGEAANHYIDLDHYCKLPCNEVPRKWKDAVEKYSEDTLMMFGIIPWNIERNMYKLTKAFEEKDANKILKYSADIGHYVGDSHVPLHTTKNYNGQYTGQYGIHGLWESRLPELFNNNYDFFVGKAEYIQNKNEFIWSNILHAHSLLEVIFSLEKEIDLNFPPDQKYSFETRGQTTVKVYSEAYSAAYHTALKGMVEDQMKRSIKHAADIWFTCWVDAGQPDLKNLKLNKEQIKADKKQLKEEMGKVKTKGHNEGCSDTHIFEAPTNNILQE